MEKELFFAHSTSDPGRSNWQPLLEHILSVGDLAGKFAAIFNAADQASAAGMLHDVGKYTEEFQRRIAGEAISVDHTTWGAKLAIERYGQLGYLLAYAIAGHHAGLANGEERGERTPLRDRLRDKSLPLLQENWRKDIGNKLPSPAALNHLPFHFVAERKWFQFAFLARMLFSCLVDADYLDTEAFYDRIEKQASARSLERPSLVSLRERLDVHLARFTADSDVKQIRAEILAHVRAQATLEPGLFSLTVPTGGGKTLTSLAFALDHAIEHGLRRVIFVIPFTSIVEQNAAVFREALGDLGEDAVLEHHSAYIAQEPSRKDAERYQSKEKLRLAMENWDAPIVVTTAVQFFESLFAARSSQCRKLHNIAGSVVILDEAQTLPLGRLRPVVAAISELALNYKASLVLCTATQPALNVEDLKGGLEKVRELAPNPPSLFQRLERVKIRPIGLLDDEALIAKLHGHEQALCIVNNRSHARAVYQAMKAAELSGARHLSTLMCAKHRSAILSEIREDLKACRPCRLVSTSLIEAGVDVDFPLVLRAEAGLDSIAQAAGRCNREGKREISDSEVLVFSNPDGAPPPELAQFAQAAAGVLGQHSDAPLSPEAIRAYFHELYWQKGEKALDKDHLLEQCRKSRIDTLPMETLAAQFRMIEQTGQMPVIVPYDNKAQKTLKTLRDADKIGRLARDLQPYLVQLPKCGFDALLKSGAIQPVAPEKWGEQFMALTVMDCYDPDFGLSWDDPEFLKTESLYW